tara:strand:+ start:5719 stop:6846 length:1128 start_codon:yes stop_codon:yes gene_type:complete
MATTIKLKNTTTGGDVPASLSQGEVAINVTDGVFYYGGASAVQQNFTLGAATVSGNTVCQGTLIVTGKTTMANTLSATTSVKVGNGDGLVSAATVTASGTLTANSLVGTLGTAAQGNVTSLGTLSNLSITQGEPEASALVVTAIEGNVTDVVTISNSDGISGFKVNSDNQVVIGYLENTPIGTTTASSGRFSTLESTGILNISGTTRLTEGGTAFTPRPNLYFHANCDAVTTCAATNGSLPATNVTTVSFAENINGEASVFSIASDVVTIARAGIYKFTYNCTLENDTTNNRASGLIALLRKPTGGSYAVVDGTESNTYNRMSTADRNTGSASVLYSVTADDEFELVFTRVFASTSTTKLKTVQAGTSLTIEAIT